MPTDPKATVRVLKQVDRDLMTVRELVRAAIKSDGKDIAVADINTRLKAAATTFASIGTAGA